MLVNFKEHLFGGIFGFLIALFAMRMFNQHITNIIPLESASFLLYLGIFVYFALFPDIDTDSKIEAITYAAGLFIILALIYLHMDRAGALIGAALCVPKITSHRKLMHNLTTGAFLAVMIGWFGGVDYGLFAFFGFVTHKILDI